MPVPGVLLLVQNGIRWQLPQTLVLPASPSGTPSTWNASNPSSASSESSFVKERRLEGGYGTFSRNSARSSRSAPLSVPARPSSFTPHSPTAHIVDPSVLSTNCRVQLRGSSASQFASTSRRVLAVFRPP